MKTSESHDRLSRRSKPEERTESESMPAQVDRVVIRIIRALRRGHSARLPGLGTLIPGKTWTFDPEPAEPGSEFNED